MGNGLDSLLRPQLNHVRKNRAFYEWVTAANYYLREQRIACEVERMVQQEKEWYPSGGIEWQPRTQIVQDEQDPQVVRRAQNHYTGLIILVLCSPEAENWAPADYTFQPVYLALVSNMSREYETINQLFKSTNQKCYCITKIERIQNPYLLCAFLLKKEELQTRLGYTPEVRDLFHGTKCSSVSSICMNNFDWRRHGEHVGTKFGKGVSFSPISNYATHYSDEEREGKVMLLVKVLIGKTCVGRKNMALPPGDFDTTGKENGEVIVKYEDNEFYPAYKITYDFTGNFDPNKNRGRRQKKVNLSCDNYYVDYAY